MHFEPQTRSHYRFLIPYKKNFPSKAPYTIHRRLLYTPKPPENIFPRLNNTIPAAAAVAAASTPMRFSRKRCYTAALESLTLSLSSTVLYIYALARRRGFPESRGWAPVPRVEVLPSRALRTTGAQHVVSLERAVRSCCAAAAPSPRAVFVARTRVSFRCGRGLTRARLAVVFRSVLWI